MKKLFTLVAGALVALSLSAQSASYELHSNGRTADLAVRARQADDATASRRITLRPHDNAAMQPNISMKSATGPLKAPDDINLIGFVSDKNPYSPAMGGMYKIPYRASQTFERIGVSTVYNQWGGVERNGLYYATYQFQVSPTTGYNYLYIYNTSTWVTTGYKMLNDFTLFASAQACDPTDNNIYGSYLNAAGTGYEFGMADYDNGSRSTICELETPWSLCAIDDTGTLYVIDADGELYTVDKTSGEMTLISPTGIISKYLGGGVYDSKGRRILWSVCNDLSSGLYSVDPATGETALVTEFSNNEEVLGMFIGAPVANDDAPEQAADLAVDFPDGSMSGTVSFTVPAVTYGGAQGTGEVNWSVTQSTQYASNIPVASGTAAYGERVDVPATGISTGLTTFIVTLSNEAGNGPQAKTTAFIGKGTPNIPLVKLEYDEVTENATLSWAPITTAVDGGYLNPDDVTYSITRYPGNVLLASHIKECTYVDHLPAPKSATTYQYSVVAENGDVVSGYGNSLQLRLGSYAAPFVDDFTLMDNRADYTYLDINNDGNSWVYNYGGAMVSAMQNIPMDDWLFTPGIALEAGKKYYIELTFRTLQMQAPYADIEVKMGTNNSLDALNTTIVDKTSITELSKAPVSAIFQADKDTKYYLGIHAMAELSNWVQVQKIVIKEATMPGPVTDITVTPGPDDALDAIVEFKAPAVNAAGDPITSIDKIDVVRSGVFVKSFENPTPGELLNFEDAVFSAGSYQWVITAYNEGGTGLEASIIEYVGLAVPAMPQNVKSVEEGNTGLVTLTWDPVTLGAHGRPLSPEFIKYRILNQGMFIDNNPDVTDNKYSAKMCNEDEQRFAQLGLNVYNDQGSSTAYSKVLAVGKPYTEYKESYAGGKTGHEQAIADVLNAASWGIQADAAKTGPESADLDGGSLMMASQYVGGTATLILGKFNLADCKAPALSLNIYNYGDEEDHQRNTLEVLVDKGNGYEVVDTFVPGDDASLNSWIRFSTGLADYAHSGNIVIALRGTIVNFQFIPVDKIIIGSTHAHDLAAINFSCPAKVNSGRKFGVTLHVENNGSEAAENFAVALMQDGKEVARKEVASLDPYAMTEVFFSHELSTLVSDEVTFSAEVLYDADEVKADNATHEVVVNVKHPVYPAPGTLTAEVADGKVNLAWGEPSKEIPAREHTEGFEDGEGMVHDQYDDWTFIDGDGALTYYYGNFYAGCSDPKAYVVFDPEMNGAADPEFAPHSGKRYIASVCVSTGVANDDWAISPELTGDAQTVSFFARSLWANDGGETFEFLYSADGLAPEDFTSLATVEGVPAEWTEYSYELPAGAKYFAIRCISFYQYMFMVDDVTFVPAGSATADLEHQGYHVYRDEARLTTDMLTARAHTDAPAEDGDYTYTVTAMYNHGESVPTNRVLVTVAHDGIGDATISAVTVTGGIGTITVTGAEGLDVTVSDMAGKTVAASKGNLHASVAPGCYLVKAGTRATKVMVR